MQSLNMAYAVYQNLNLTYKTIRGFTVDWISFYVFLQNFEIVGHCFQREIMVDMQSESSGAAIIANCLTITSNCDE
jgi:hypothetical protein